MIVLEQSTSRLPSRKIQKSDNRTVSVDKIAYIDFPELKLDEHESTEMPFRYVVSKSGGPIMPEVRSNIILAGEDFSKLTEHLCREWST